VELRAYWTIIWRRIWLVALIVGVVALYVGYQYYHLRKTPGALTAYRSDITMQIGLQATSNGVDPSYADDVVVSESLADALVGGPILTSSEFDKDVSSQIGKDMGQITQRYGPNPNLGPWQDSGAIGGALSAVRVHSLVTISATWSSAEGAWAITNAIGEVSTDHIGRYLDYVVSNDTSRLSTGNDAQPEVSARVISSATEAVAVPGSSTSRLTLLIILLFVALIVGIALAFLADYLDDRIHSKDDAAYLLQLPIYGQVPRAAVVGRSRPVPRVPTSGTPEDTPTMDERAIQEEIKSP